MGVNITRGFPRRQEDPLIQQLLERARQQAAQSSAIGSPRRYSVESYGGNFPIGTLTAQILGGARAGVAEREAQKRQEMSDVALNLLGSIEPNSQFDYNNRIIFTDEEGNFLEQTPLAEILKEGRDPVLRKTSIRIGPDDDPNVLERIFLGKALKGKDISKKSDLITLAGYSPLEYDLFQDQLKQKTSPKFTQIKLGDKLFEVQLDSQGQYIKGSEKEILDAEQQYIKPETYKVTLKNGDTVEVDGRTKTGGKLELNIDGTYQDASILIKNKNIESFERSQPEGTKIVSTTNINQKAQNKLIGENIAPLRKQHFETTSNENKKKALQAINQTSQLLDLFSRTNEQGGDLTGTGAEFFNLLRGLIKTLGAEVDEKALTSIQNMGAISREKVIPLAKQLGVNPTDFDFKNLIETAPKAANTPAANMYLIRVLAYYANQQADKIAYLQSLNVRTIDNKPTLTFSTEEGTIQYAQEVEAYYNKLKEEDKIFFKKLAADPFNLTP
jgi:hypothetical protein